MGEDNPYQVPEASLYGTLEVVEPTFLNMATNLYYDHIDDFVYNHINGVSECLSYFMGTVAAAASIFCYTEGQPEFSACFGGLALSSFAVGYWIRRDNPNP
ncbi:MAG: hypothetical protein KJ601_07425 [Nanoarchaeota archaeon]|nr:hypothetical protein [Nanoarchaeota archaeon]